MSRNKKPAKELPNKPRKYGSKFNDEWMEKKEYNAWLGGVEDDKSRARCTICSSTFDISNMRLSAIEDHHKGQKHLRRLAAIKNQSQSITSFFRINSTSSSSAKPVPSLLYQL